MSELYNARLLNGVLELGKPVHVDGQIPVERLPRIPGSGVQRHVPRENTQTTAEATLNRFILFQGPRRVFRLQLVMSHSKVDRRG
jgi:hypothetical protein